MLKTPFLSTNHSAASIAPSANPSREWASCLILNVSIFERYSILCVPFTSPSRSAFIDNLSESLGSSDQSFFSENFKTPSARVIAVPLGASFFLGMMNFFNGRRIVFPRFHKLGKVFIQIKEKIDPHAEIGRIDKASVTLFTVF